MECKGLEKRKLPSCAEHEKKQRDREKCRKRPAQDDDEDEVREFFALVDRIHAMHKLYKQKTMERPSAGEIPTSQNEAGNVIKGKSAWKLSFEWEDFSALAGKDSSTIYCSNNNGRTLVVSQKPCIRIDQNIAVGNFDLNVEATAEE